MLVCFWSPKGGSGTSVVAAAAALVLAREGPARVADLAGDLPAVLGLATDPELGLRDWLRAGPEAPTDALDRLAVDAGRGLGLLPAGAGDLTGDPPGSGRRARGRAPRRPAPDDRRRRASSALTPTRAAPSSRSPTSHVIVVRGCYLALRRAVRVERTIGASGVRRTSTSTAVRSVRATSTTCSAIPILATRRHPRVDRPGRRRRRAADPAPRRARRDRCARCCAASAASIAKKPRERRSAVTARPLRDALHRRLLAAPFDPATARARRAARPARRAAPRRSAARRTQRPRRRRARRARRRRRRARSAAAVARRSDDHRDHGERAEPRVRRARRAGSSPSRATSTPTRSCASRSACIAPLGLRLDRAVADGRRPACPTARGCTRCCRRSRPTGRASRSAASRSRRSRSPTSASIAPRCAFLEAMVRAGWNIVVSGATSAGKTTCCNALAARDRSARAHRHDRGDGRAPARATRTSSGSRRGPRTRKAPARSRCASSSAPRCGCDRIGSSSARSAAARRSTCCRRSTPVTTVRSRRCTPTRPPTRWPGSRRSCCSAAWRCRSRRCAPSSRRRSTRSCRSPAARPGSGEIVAVAEVSTARGGERSAVRRCCVSTPAPARSPGPTPPRARRGEPASTSRRRGSRADTRRRTDRRPRSRSRWRGRRGGTPSPTGCAACRRRGRAGSRAACASRSHARSTTPRSTLHTRAGGRDLGARRGHRGRGRVRHRAGCRL